ncbi:MAG: DUF4254 domain-containing protein [Bilophila sp.]
MHESAVRDGTIDIPDPALSDTAPSPNLLQELVIAQHLRNFQLWHVEDIARRRDVTPGVIADCKYRIDALNQERNDRVERVDACLVALMTPLLPKHPSASINTESLGMALDRLSILSLKIWHMDEQLHRDNVTPEHLASCQTKLDILHTQRTDLADAVVHLVGEFLHGTKTPKLYFQFKMYNDPTLNPELYGN